MKQSNWIDLKRAEIWSKMAEKYLKNIFDNWNNFLQLYKYRIFFNNMRMRKFHIYLNAILKHF